MVTHPSLTGSLTRLSREVAMLCHISVLTPATTAQMIGALALRARSIAAFSCGRSS